MTFSKVKQERLSDAIVRQLESLILKGVLQPGERLPPERELAAQLEVSRPSVREALQRLEASGLVETRHGGGTYVRNAFAAALTDPLTDLFQRHPEAAADFVEFRHTLDGAVAYYAALRATETDREILTQRFRAIERAHGKEDFAEEANHDADFHVAIAEASHNIVLLHVVRSMLDLLRKDVVFNRTLLYAHKDARDLLMQQHRDIYQHIMSGDAEGARAAAEAHMCHVGEALRAGHLSEARADVSRLRLARWSAGERAG
ncbi:MAG: GntR family transcriptional regulator [Rhodospirillales bacterium]|nr:GntR family transcriptional regulator [Rhodospirillales bacterium]